MPSKTDLNVTPYYDDYDKTKNFQQILARPGYAVQARELTQMQSIIKEQVEKLGDFVLQEGAMVIPGQVRFLREFPMVKLDSSFGGASIDPTQYKGKYITGNISGVKAFVHHVELGTSTEAAILYMRYTAAAATDNTQTVFSEGESLSASESVTHESIAFAADAISAQVASPSSTGYRIGFVGSTGKGCGATIQEGVYYIRGSFVNVSEQTIIVEKYNFRTASGRVGFTVTESIVTPEGDSTLLDNAAGTSNYAAKGSHRLKIECTLAVIPIGSTEDSSFINLMEVKNGDSLVSPDRSPLGIIIKEFARRTYEESGDYTVRPFLLQVLETVTLNENEGIYSKGDITSQGNIASNEFLTMKVSPGKAFVRGYEIEKMVNVFVDIPKARSFANVNSGITTFDIGNFITISNIYGSPDITQIAGEATPYKQIDLFDVETSTRGSSSGTRIGVGRARSIEYVSGDVGSATASYKLFMFDLRPFTFLTLSGTPSPTLEANHATGGVQITGVTSKATGWVFADGTGGAEIILTNVSGTFVAGEKLTASDSAETDGIIENSGNVDLTLTRAISKSINQARQVFMTDVDGGQNFSADIVLDALPTTESYMLLDGTDVVSSDTEDNIIGELDSIPLGLERAATGSTGSSLAQAKLKFSEKNIGLFKLLKPVVKTHLTTKNAGISDTSYNVRRQFITYSSSVGVVTISAATNEVFQSHSETDYMVTILAAGSGGTGQQGDVVSASTGFSGGGTGTVIISNSSVFGNGAKLKITATLLKSSAIAKVKQANLMKQVKVAGAVTGAYGTRPTDKTLSLGRADSFKLVAVLDSEATDTDASTPELTLGTVVGNFEKGEEITGSISGAVGRIIDTSSPMKYVRKRGIGAQFSTSDIILGFSSGATAPVTAVTKGSTNITDRFELDTGQRDNYYDISRIVRKSGTQLPLGRLLIVHDFMEHGTGDFFTVDSYSDVANQMTYEDIPKYSATKVDPDDPTPSGEYDLQDVFDMRPRVSNITGTSSNNEAVDIITGNSFDFANRNFQGTGGSTINTMKPGSLIQSDFEYYLPYRGRLFINKQGVVKFLQGNADENPNFPEPIKDAMLIASLSIPAYTFKPSDVGIMREKNRRYTMKDIGKLEQRIDHVEYYTSLSLLERDAESFQIQDANGLDRFKSGFITDTFAGHSIGDVKHRDYKCSIDMQKNELRPACVPKGIKLQESVATDTERASLGYQKTGDLITLPYEEVLFQEQPYATRVERVTPVLMSTWTGQIDLDPEGDEWFETEFAPDLIVNVEGNFDTFTAANQNAVGTVWNAWQTTWSGITGSTSVTNQDSVGNLVTRSTTTTRSDLERAGVQTSIVAQVDLESQGSRVIQRAFIPFMRQVNITFTGFNFFPNIRLYCFFDGKNVNEYVTPLSGFTTDAADVSGVVAAKSPLITTAAGEIKGILSVPDPKIEGNPSFRTGEVEFRLTSSATDVRSKDPETSGTTQFLAVGILETEQETIVATRNARLVRTLTSQTTSISSQSVQTRVLAAQNNNDIMCGCAGNDPLAQTFIVTDNFEIGATSDILGVARSAGRFLTSADIYFSAKDENLSIRLEIHNTQNGYPGSKVLPFARRVLNPSQINISNDASIATRFTFPSPVYVLHEEEYALCLMSSTPEYKIWISRLGETEISDNRIVSKQPHTGTLFKGHNNRSWAPSMTEDMKFKINVAKFNTNSTGKMTLQNETVPSRRLIANALTFQNGDTNLLVNHLNHGMYNSINNVTISGVVSGASTTLSQAMAFDATTLTILNSTDFNDSSGKFAYDSSSQYWIKINDEIMKYTVISGTSISSVTRAQNSTSAVAHPAGSVVELYMLYKVPLTEVNKTFETISNFNMDSYSVTLTTSPTVTGGTTNATNGGDNIFATENISMDALHPSVSVMEVAETEAVASVRPMTSTSPSGSQVPFVQSITSQSIDLNNNIEFDTPYMIASEINESNEAGGAKSFNLDIELSSLHSDVSPVIDMGRVSAIAIGNRINTVDTIIDVYPQDLYDPSTDPVGDDNSAIYITRKVTLENPATAIKVFFAGHRHASSDIELYHKILRTDDASEFDDLSYEPFNIDGSPDVAVKASTTRDNFTEYLYTAGVTDDGLGTPLDEFIAFQIKIVLKGTNSAEVPRIKDLRAIALAI